MKDIKAKLRFFYAVYLVMAFCIKGIICGLFTNRKRFYRSRIGSASCGLMKKLGSTLTLEGIERLDPKKQYILMGNHQSYTDILIVFVAMSMAKKEVIFMSKKEIFYVPFLGTTMKSLGMIPVERGNSAKAFKSLIAAVKSLKEGANLVIFPEGTRSVDGKLLPFKKGGFILASRSGMDIAPFIIKGAGQFMPKTGFGIYPTDIKVTFLPIVENNGRKDNELLELVRSEMEGIETVNV